MDRLAKVITILIAVIVLTGTVTYGHSGGRGKYTWKCGGRPRTIKTCKRQDPINIMFFKDATAGGVYFHIAADARWRDTIFEPLFSAQYFYDHGHMDVQSGSFATAGFLANRRFHVRFEQGKDPEPYAGRWTTANVHRDTLVRGHGCRKVGDHVAGSFNASRKLLIGKIENYDLHNHIQHFSTNERNAAPSPQCNGSKPRSNGRLWWMDIP